MRIGLCLEGGAMKGIYTAAILDYFLENNIHFDEIVGVSAGALFGVNYKSKQIGRVIRYNLKYCDNKHYMGTYSLLTTGNIMNRKFCFNDLIYKLDPFDIKTYNDNKDVSIKCVVANCKKGIAEYIELDDFTNQDQIEYLRATGSMPYVSHKVKIGKNKYLDGAIFDSIPFEYMLNSGVDKLVVISTKPKGFKMHKYNSLVTWALYFPYPLLARGIINRYKMYNKQMEELERLEKEQKVFVIRPSKEIKMSRIEKDRKIIQAMYDLGKENIKNNIEDMLKFINQE